MNTTTILARTTAQRIALAGAVAFGAAPAAVGLSRYASTGWDLRLFWMALVATVFAGGVLASAIGKRRSRRTALVQSAVIAVVGTLLAWFIGDSLGATEGPGAMVVAAVFGLCLGVASECIVLSRVTPGHAS
jgi:peptidoglycan/LPS O-acetylase OafA/YrhL